MSKAISQSTSRRVLLKGAATPGKAWNSGDRQVVHRVAYYLPATNSPRPHWRGFFYSGSGARNSANAAALKQVATTKRGF